MHSPAGSGNTCPRCGKWPSPAYDRCSRWNVLRCTGSPSLPTIPMNHGPCAKPFDGSWSTNGNIPATLPISCRKGEIGPSGAVSTIAVSYTHLRAHETRHDLVCRLLLEKKKKK